MAKITISTPEYDLELENSELIPATEKELKAIVKKAFKNTKEKTTAEVMSEVVPAINLELQRLQNEVENLKSEASTYVSSLKPKNGEDYILTEDDLAQIVDMVEDLIVLPADGEDGDNGKDGEFTEEIRDELALSVESQLAPMIIDETKPEVLRNKLETLEDDERLDASAIKNLPEMPDLKKFGTQFSRRDTNRLRDQVDFDPTGTAGQVVTLEADGTFNLQDAATPLTNTDGLSEGESNLYYTNERVDDQVAGLLAAGTNITLDYDDPAGTLTINAVVPTVDDTAYGASWDGNTDAPTKNAVYDKIETIGGGSPGGADTQVQFNDAGSFGGDANFTWIAADQQLNVGSVEIRYQNSDENLFIGKSAGNGSSTALGSVAIGENALGNNTAGDYSIGIGLNAGLSNSSTGRNISIGVNAGRDFTGSNSLFMGLNAGLGMTSGTRNVVFGETAGGSAGAASSVVFIGREAGRYNTGSNNTFMGNFAGRGAVGSSGGSNTAIGVNAGTAITTATNCLFLGVNAGLSTTTTPFVTAIGNEAGRFTTADQQSIFLGSFAGRNADGGFSNMYVGYESGRDNQGNFNVFFGNSAARSNTTGGNNTFIGGAAGLSNTTGSFQIAIGYQAMGDPNAITGGSNVAIGYRSGYQITTGVFNIGIGRESMYDVTTGSFNTAIGYRALFEASTTSNNTAIGYFAGGNLTGSNCTFIGTQAGLNATTGSNNVGVGYLTMQSGSITGINNTGLGTEALRRLTSGNSNIGIGLRAGDEITSGKSNIIVGASAGGTITTGDSNVIIGNSADVGTTSVQRSILLGDLATTSASNDFVVGSTTRTINTFSIGVQATGNPLLLGSTDRVEALGYLTCNDSGATAQAGDIRYNSSTNKHEGYDGTSWNAMY